jgi:hypothetical protein
MATSQNGWLALEPDSDFLYTWVIPATNGRLELRLRRGCVGFLLVHFLLWFSETIEDLTGGVRDDWGYSYRDVRGQMNDLSNHASGTAADANATRHPMGLRGTFKAAWRYAKIRARLALYLGCIRWGGDYKLRADEMHFEINRGFAVCRRLARRLASSPRGKRILAANPSQRRHVL